MSAMRMTMPLRALRGRRTGPDREAASALYLRLPARAGGAGRVQPAQSLPSPSLPFALTVRGRIGQQGSAPLGELSQFIAKSQRVVMLLAASDVTLLRITVPPLPASRLREALPVLAEDRIIGDPADCVLAAGPDENGLRSVAIVDRAWLSQWAGLLRGMGARRLSALPLQLCLPLPAGRVAAALPGLPSSPNAARELVLHFAPGEGAGLPLDDAGGAGAPAEVLRTLAALTGGRPLQLSVPADDVPLYRDALAAHAAAHASDLPDTELRAESWSDWLDGASRAEIDLMTGVDAEAAAVIDWRRWRLPAALAAAVLLFNVLALNWDWWQLQREGRRLQADMLQTYRAALPQDAATDDAVLADPVGKMKQRRLALQRATGEPAPGDFLALSAAVGDAWPALQQVAGIDARALAGLDYRDGSLRLRLKSVAPPALEPARKLLAERQLELAPAGEANVWAVRSAL